MIVPKVFNKYTDRDVPYSAVYVGRGSPWGNPFKIGTHGDRALCIARFRDEVMPTLDLTPLRGKHLVCFCAPRACHADELLKAANA